MATGESQPNSGRRSVDNRWRLDAHDRQLLFASILCGTRGVLYGLGASQSNSFVLDRVDEAIPIQFYAVLWMGASIWGFTDTVRHKQGRWSSRAMSLLCVLWGFFYLISAVFIAPWQAVTAIFFFGLAGLIKEIPKMIATNSVVTR